MNELSTNSNHLTTSPLHTDLFPIFRPTIYETTQDDSSSPEHEHNEFAGDVLTRREDAITRLVFGNVNGLQLGDGGHRWDSICKDLQAMEADIVGLAEINMDDTKFEANQVLHTVMKKNFEHYSAVTSSSSISAATLFKPGGTMSLLHADVVGRISTKGTDHLGRWSFHKLVGKAGRIITIITAYQVCERTSHAVNPDDGMTAYVQQERLLRQEGHSNINPRKHFCADILSFVRALRANDESVILCGDFNEVLTLDSELVRLCTDPSIQLVDIFSNLHPQTDVLPTFERGSTRIDFALISPDLVPAIARCGYMPFRLYVESDHRFLFLDLSTEIFLGDPSTLASLPTRNIRAKDPRAVTSYLEAKYLHLKNNNFFDRLRDMMASEIPQPELAENLDCLLLQASTHAGKKCDIVRRAWWSTELAKANEKVRILNMARNNALTNMVYDLVTSFRRQYIDIDYSPPQDLASIKVELQKAQHERNKIRRESRSYRDRFLDSQAEAAALHGRHDKVHFLRQIVMQEQSTAMWRKLALVNPLQRSKGLNSVKVPKSWPATDAGDADSLENPKTCQEWKTVDTPKEMLQYLLKRNKMHFGQAQGTPFTVEPLSVMFDWAANTATAELVLAGDYSPTELSDLQQLLIQHCRREFEPDPADATTLPTITTQEWKRRIRRWKESTTTSPSGMHLGHARALIARHSLHPKSPEGKRLSAIQEDLIQAQVSMLNYSIKHGHSYSRWKNVVNVMIEKDPGDVRIHRLRVIHLYEHDFGLFLAIYWKRMLRASEARGTINAGQYGGRAGLEAQSLVFLEEIKTEICTMSRKSLVNFDNDAASCYDRIIPSLASLIGRKKGIHRNVVLVHATTLQEAKYKLKTAMGVSEEFYQNCSSYPIYGTGQGSTNSPVIWIIISSTLFDIHNQQAHGATFCSPDQSISISFSIVGFVDDSNCQTNNFMCNNQEECDDLLASATADAQLWADLLWVSGGYLELQKCSYHLLHFDFASNGRPFMTNRNDLGLPISVIDAKNQDLLEIPKKAPGMPHKTLGHLKAPAGNGRSQRKYLQAKCEKIASRITRSSLTAAESRTYYDAIFLPSVNYVLPQCFFTPSELRSIGSKAQQAFVRKCGFSRTMALVVRYGPRELGGAGFITLETLQGEGQLLNFLKHYRTNSPVSRVLQATIGWAQLMAGVEEPILASPSLHLPHLEGRLIPSMRQFLHRIHGAIEVDRPCVPEIQRVDDRYLMNMALECGRFSDPQICLINFCRLYLQVVTLSDIVLADGHVIDPAIQSGTLSLLSSSTRWLHVNQRRPDKPTWSVWKAFLRILSVYLDDHPLGAWLASPSKLRRSWPVYFDVLSKRVYLRTADGYVICHRRTSVCYSIGWTRVPEPPESSVPAGATIHENDVLELFSPLGKQAIKSSPAPATFLDFASYVASLPDSDKRLLDNVHFHIGPFEIVQRCHDLQESGKRVEFLTVSDGSAAKGSMSFGWKCVLSDGTVVAEASGPAYGARATSYRSEGYGLTSASVFFLHLFRFCDVPPCGSFKFVSDNLGLIRKINQLRQYSEHFPNITLQPDWDLIREIQLSLQQLGRPATFSHVKGHQDDHQEYHELSLEARLNIDADHLAGSFRKHDPAIRPLVPRVKSNPAQLRIDGKTIPGGYRQAIRRATSYAPLLAYINQKNDWSSATSDMIDWDAHSAALRACPKRSTQLTKLCHEILPTATRTHRYDQRNSPDCPRCRAHPESTDHLLQCPVPERKAWATATLKQLATVSTSRSDHHDIILDIFVSGFEQWMGGSCLSPDSYPLLFRDLIESQAAIGWNQILRGRVSILWAKYIDEALSLKSPSHPSSSGHLWVKSMILKVWERFFVLWEERNAVVHGTDASDQTRCRKVRLLRELHQIHELRSEVLPADLIFFIAPTSSDDSKIASFVQDHGPSFIQNWVNTNRPLFLQSKRDASRTAAKGSRRITEFFQSVRAPVSRQSRLLYHRASAALRGRGATRARPRQIPNNRRPSETPGGPLLPSYFTR